MDHPFKALKPEYSQLLTAMVVRPECRDLVDRTAEKLLGFKRRYAEVAAQNCVPIIFMAPSFEREASSDFTRNPAQGWPLNSISKEIPHNGPFPNWKSAALAAYHLNGLDKVGAGNWTWELICFYGELFNGFGYRDYHHMHTPYLWAGTNIQTIGKYTEDKGFDPTVMDAQLGTIPVARRMVELDSTLALPFVVSPPIASGIAAEPDSGAKWVQETLNTLGQTPALTVTGSYDRPTFLAVLAFQKSYGLHVDGIVGPETTAGLRQAQAAQQQETAA
jgi:lysozyme family protein